jgi:hypothetical protein
LKQGYWLEQERQADASTHESLPMLKLGEEEAIEATVIQLTVFQSLSVAQAFLSSEY